MSFFKCTVAYEGTLYAGWQVQPAQKTVTGTLQDSFLKVFGHEIKIIGASRTDAGVHAHGQIAHFTAPLSLDPTRMAKAWNTHLPSDVVIRKLEYVGPQFHARFGVKQKIYQYRIFTTFAHPFYQRFGAFWPYPLDLALFEHCLGLFVGRHDFRSFCTGEHDVTIRSIDSIALFYDEVMGAHVVEVRGRSFLHHMIRRIVGASLKVASFDRDSSILEQALIDRNPRQELYTAPAAGLMLYEIIYE